VQPSEQKSTRSVPKTRLAGACATSTLHAADGVACCRPSTHEPLPVAVQPIEEAAVQRQEDDVEPGRRFPRDLVGRRHDVPVGPDQPGSVEQIPSVSKPAVDMSAQKTRSIRSIIRRPY
jgi:hypothetical protein